MILPPAETEQPDGADQRATRMAVTAIACVVIATFIPLALWVWRAAFN